MTKYKKDWLNDKTVIISGASSGIGRGISKLLIEKFNCNIIGIGRNEGKMLSLKEELGDKADKFTYKLFDVSSIDNWKSFAEELISNNTAIDVLINNAGLLPPFKSANKFTPDEVKHNFEINFFSYIYAIDNLLPIIKQSNTPAIINMSSADALSPIIGTSVYSSTKASVKCYTEVMREEFRGIMYVGLICPGFVKTDIFRNQTRTQSKLIDFFSMRCDKACKKIVKGIKKRRTRMVVGADAKLMDILYRLFPRFSLRLVRKVLKSSRQDLFCDIFE